ncbi:MAG TPA: nitroreductase [Clostridiales bacterium]|nr:nitroreductase [Clostridiales bacterium]
MSFLDVAKKRCSVRNYLPKDVEEEKLLKVLEAARVAPSACNLQPWQIIVVRDFQLKLELYESYPREWFAKAPVILVVCVDHSQSWKRFDGKDYGDVDATIAADHMTLAAADLGLGTCWIGAFDANKCRKALDLPGHMEPIAMLPLGYPAKTDSPDRHETRRKSLDEIIRWE